MDTFNVSSIICFVYNIKVYISILQGQAYENPMSIEVKLRIDLNFLSGQSLSYVNYILSLHCWNWIWNNHKFESKWRYQIIKENSYNQPVQRTRIWMNNQIGMFFSYCFVSFIHSFYYCTRKIWITIMIIVIVLFFLNGFL